MRVLALCLVALCSFPISQAITLRTKSLHEQVLDQRNKPSVQVQGTEIIGRDWSGTDYGSVVTFFDVRYAPGACPNCTQPRFSKLDSSRWSEGLSSPIMADGPAPLKLCMQPEMVVDIISPSGYETTEDCNYLDIYVPRKAIMGKRIKANRNVLVFIHGGGGIGGSKASASWFYYAAKGYPGLPGQERPIVVTINYRLLSFSSIRHPDIDPENWNLGRNDAVEALKWVQRNIASFGGDKSKVTIMGESQGAKMVAHLTRSPSARGLFRGAISISGFADAIYSISASDERASEGFAEFTNALEERGSTIFNVSTDFSYTEPTASTLTLNLYEVSNLPATKGMVFTEDVTPMYSGLDIGRDESKDVPIFVLNMDQEYHGGPISCPGGCNGTYDGYRAFVDTTFIGASPLYLRCLQNRLEKMELDNGADPLVALLRAAQIVRLDVGYPQALFRNRTNAFTATIMQNYKVCDSDPSRTFSLAEPHHSAGGFGEWADLAPWNPMVGTSPDALRNDSSWFGPIPCKTVSSQKDALRTGFLDKSGHDKIRKAIVEFVVNGTPGWRSDQHAYLQPGKKLELETVMNDRFSLASAFLTKCDTECHVPPYENALVNADDDVCEPIIENLECKC